LELTRGQIDAFNQDGFVIVDNVFNETELENFNEALRWVIKAALRKGGMDPADYQDREFGAALVDLEARDHQLLSEIYDVAANLPEFVRLTAKPVFGDLTNQILGRPKGAPVYSMTCRCRIDPPMDTIGHAKWHQEIFYSVPESRFVQVWAPLIRPATVANGAMQVCVGSNRLGIVNQTWDEAPGKHRQMYIDQDVLDAHEHRSTEAEVGQIVLFSPHLIHRSGTNVSDAPRITLIGAYHDVDNPRFQAPGISYRFRTTQFDYYQSVMQQKGMGVPA
jgi:ectoine hydroxylase-related dioxygenase (phytanoyl-CoA dioxygenase family)